MVKKGDLASNAVPSPAQLIDLSSIWYGPPGMRRSGYGAPVQRYEVPLAPAGLIVSKSSGFFARLRVVPLDESKD
jgi:hypothetical protein